MLCLVDTGCHASLVSKRIFGDIPKIIQHQRMDCDTHQRNLRGELDK